MHYATVYKKFLHHYKTCELSSYQRTPFLYCSYLTWVLLRVQKRYQHRHTERAVDIIEDGVMQNQYRVDLK